MKIKLSLFVFIALIIPFACKNSKQADERKWNVSDTSILRDNSFFKIAKDAFTYKNISYYFGDFSFSPYFTSRPLIKETKTVVEYRTADLIDITTKLEIISDLETNLMTDRVIEKKASEIKLYSHHYECLNRPVAADDWSHIELFNYDNDSKPFTTSDQTYWLFTMSSSSEFIPKTNYFLTIKKDYDNKFLTLTLCDKSGVLQRMTVLNKSTYEIEFWNPKMDLISNNPYEYKYSPNQSRVCRTISISTKDTSNVRKHITNTKIKLKYLTTTGLADSVFIPIVDGYFNGMQEKNQELEIFKN